MTDRVLSTRELNRAVLARQLLLERSTLPLPRAVERVAGIQAQYAPSTYVGLWSRLEGLRRDTVRKALKDRTVVQGTLMRVTIHLVSARDYPLLAEALRGARRAWWIRTQRTQLRGVDMAAVARLVRARLRDGPTKQAELVRTLEDAGFPRMAFSGVGLWIDLLRIPPSGTWERRRADLYGLAEEWLGPSSARGDDGLEVMVRRYLGGFGPASMADLASWSGLPVTVLRPVVERMTLRRFRDERGGELLDLPRAPLPDPDIPAPVRFLPTWDATLLAHARRTQILPETYRSRVFQTRTPQSVATFMVDGAVAGTWEHRDGRVHLKSFGRLSRSARRELEEEGERLAAFHAGG